MDILSLNEFDVTENGRKLLSVMKYLKFTIPELITEEDRNEYRIQLLSILIKCSILESFYCTGICYVFGKHRIFDYLPVSVTNYGAYGQPYLISMNPSGDPPLNIIDSIQLIQLLNQLENKELQFYLTIPDGGNVSNSRKEILIQLSNLIEQNLICTHIEIGELNDNRGFTIKLLFGEKKRAIFFRNWYV